MNTVWRHTPASKQYWLYREAIEGRILGVVYEAGLNSFEVYREKPKQPWCSDHREFITQMGTLDEAKGLLQTRVGSQT